MFSQKKSIVQEEQNALDQVQIRLAMFDIFWEKKLLRKGNSIIASNYYHNSIDINSVWMTENHSETEEIMNNHLSKQQSTTESQYLKVEKNDNGAEVNLRTIENLNRISEKLKELISDKVVAQTNITESCSHTKL
jgi:hypothetical protein